MILAIQTAEIATCTSKGQALSARVEMIKRLLLNGVDSQSTGLAIDLADQQTSIIATASANACLALGNMTMMRAELALYPLIFQCLIILTLHYQLSIVNRQLSIINCQSSIVIKTRLLHIHKARHPSSHPNPIWLCPASNDSQTPL